jgi:threonine synthase
MRGEPPTFVTHLECSADGARYEADQAHGPGKPLPVHYALDYNLANFMRTLALPKAA